MKTPTDLEILSQIYDVYYREFISFGSDPSKSVERKLRVSKIYVPIDVDRIGELLGVDGDIIFGRLYYNLNNKYSYRLAPERKDEKGPLVEFFANSISGDGKTDKHAIHFPYLASVLAEMRSERRKHQWTIWLAGGALLVSILSTWLAAALSKC
jgi:hypothetical protein